MIRIVVLDPALEMRLMESFDMVVESRDQYLSAYVSIAEAIHVEKALSVLVRHNTVGTWFQRMQEKYGNQYISFEKRTLRSQLQKQIGVSIPNLTDQQILDSRLLELNIPAGTGIDFEDYLLEVFFGQYLTTPDGIRRVGQFVTSYEPDQWQNALERPVVRNVYERRLHSYQNTLKEHNLEGERQLIDWLLNSPEELLRKLSALKVLTNYPQSLGKKVIGRNYLDLLELHLDLRKVPIMIEGNQQALDEIRLYLNTLLQGAQPKEMLRELLEQVSGQLEVEFDAVFGLLLRGDIEITPALIRRICNIFKPLQDIPRVAQGMADAELLIRRELRETPDQDWSEEKWLQWAQDDYLPYRFWLENTGKITDEIGEIANAFSDWLYEHYGQLLYHSENMAWKNFSLLIEQAKQLNQQVLVVVIDNLNAKFYPELLKQMQFQGYYQQELRYCLSVLPTCTEISKRSLLIGHCAPFPGTNYKSIVESTWKNKLGKKVLYLANIGELREVSRCEHDVYFLNYLPLDIRLHQSENNTGISHPQAIRSYLASLAQDIRAFANRIGAERNLRVIVVSDHGSTCIPRGTINVIDKKYYKERTEDEHHRYIKISDDELSSLPAHTQYECYAFKKGVFDLEENYLVARRLYRFLPTNESVYVHGGLTPEETLVPVAVFEPITTSPKPLAVQILSGNKIYTGTRVELRLEITNYNHYPCESLAINIDDPSLEIEEVQIEEIPKLDRVEVTISGRCSNTADTSLDQLPVEITYQFLGQPCSNLSSIPVTIEAPARPKFDLDDL